MKWMMLTGVVLFASGCCTTDVVEYRQVTVAQPVVTRMVPVVPVTRVVAVPVVTRVITPVIEPVIVDYVEPVDVTTTTIDFY